MELLQADPSVESPLQMLEWIEPEFQRLAQSMEKLMRISRRKSLFHTEAIFTNLLDFYRHKHRGIEHLNRNIVHCFDTFLQDLFGTMFSHAITKKSYAESVITQVTDVKLPENVEKRLARLYELVAKTEAFRLSFSDVDNKEDSGEKRKKSKPIQLSFKFLDNAGNFYEQVCKALHKHQVRNKRHTMETRVILADFLCQLQSVSGQEERMTEFLTPVRESIFTKQGQRNWNQFLQQLRKMRPKEAFASHENEIPNLTLICDAFILTDEPVQTEQLFRQVMMKAALGSEPLVHRWMFQVFRDKEEYLMIFCEKWYEALYRARENMHSQKQVLKRTRDIALKNQQDKTIFKFSAKIRIDPLVFGYLALTQTNLIVVSSCHKTTILLNEPIATVHKCETTQCVNVKLQNGEELRLWLHGGTDNWNSVLNFQLKLNQLINDLQMKESFWLNNLRLELLFAVDAMSKTGDVVEGAIDLLWEQVLDFLRPEEVILRSLVSEQFASTLGQVQASFITHANIYLTDALQMKTLFALHGQLWVVFNASLFYSEHDYARTQGWCICLDPFS
ncbi:hypothetical protein Ciccas_013234 [Cichlidogyrus casuarinus]|uniref:Uncharacterized protein n=1 Tax=Cichlidogyrus casuarinus TaxID=1844966 RepID=A0ABD2PLN3_9PLAT